MINKYEVKVAGMSLLESTTQNCIDLGADVACDLLACKNVKADEIAVLICVTLSAVYLMPSSSFLIHKSLGLSQECFQYDCYQGGEGFIGGIQLAASLLKGFDTGRKALIVFGDDRLCVHNDEVKNIAVAMILECSSQKNVVIQNAVYSEENAKYMQRERNAERKVNDCYAEIARRHLNEQLQIMKEYITKNQVSVDNQLIYDEKADGGSMFLQNSAVGLPYSLLMNRMNGNILLGTVGSGMIVKTAVGEFVSMEDLS